MNKKALKNVIRVIAIVFCLILFIQLNEVNAFSINDLSGTKLNNQDATNLGNQIITVLTVLGASISVIILIVIGLKYMVGSVSEKAEYKKTMIPYIIGAVFVFSASTIAGVIYNVVNNIG